ncbi:AAA family ATPase, partial [Desulfococcaceae bacterium HSG8]|nr:AAA family ATPase [Desulfococcaceae bacterium HSG8]
MKYLFIDNFRGFSKTYIPIKDVNFFVGENSTGKTSVLTLLKLISSPSFWRDQSFNNDDISFTDFKDIVSINSPDKSFFHIGMIDFQPDDEKKTNAFLMTFINSNG